MYKNPENIDYIAELIVSQLITNKKIENDHTYIHLLGVFRRFFCRDIDKIEVSSNKFGSKECNIYIHREGLFDMLPEGLFIRHSQKSIKSSKETIREFLLHKKEEKSARQFFMPLEQEFFKYLVDKEISEQNFFYAPETIHEFIDFYNLDNLNLNMYQQASLFFILPHLQKIVGNLSLTETCFEIILQEHVTIRSINKPLLNYLDNELPELGNCELGINSVTGEVFVDNNPQLIIEVGPLQSSNSLLNYIEGKTHELIQRLIDLFIQADLKTEINTVLCFKDEEFILGERNYEARLKYSTTI